MKNNLKCDCCGEKIKSFVPLIRLHSFYLKVPLCLACSNIMEKVVAKLSEEAHQRIENSFKVFYKLHKEKTIGDLNGN